MKRLSSFSIKSKLTAALFLFLCVQALVLVLLSRGAYDRYERLVVHDYRSKFRLEAEKINAVVIRLQEDAQDLALIGEVFYRATPTRTGGDGFLRGTLRDFFMNRLIGIGGGLWFEPYAVEKDQERLCYFLYRKDNAVVFDESYVSDPINYLEQAWYKTLMRQLSVRGDKGTAWTRPYEDVTGTRTRMVTVGSGVHDDDGKLAGLATIDWDMTKIMRLIETMFITPRSFALLADPANNYVLVTNDPHTPAPIGSLLSGVPWYSDHLENERGFVYNDVRYLPFVWRLDNGMQLIVNMPEDEMFQELRRSTRLLLAAYLVAAAIATLLMYWLLNRLINRPVRYLSKKAQAIGAGDLNTGIRLDSGDELGSLAESLQSMTANLRNHVENLKIVTAERERIGAELAIAKDIQESFLPRTFPDGDGRAGYDLYAIMHPAREVGGDFYDFFPIDDDRIAVVVADVSGKGVPAALYMVIAKTLINNHAKRGLDAGGVFTAANRQLCENEDMGMFVTAFLGILDLRSGRLSYANAGHNPPLVARKNAPAEKVEAPADLFLGVMGDIEYRQGEIMLAPGDLLYLYTDGVTEAENPREDMFGMDRLLVSVDRNRAGGENLRALLDGVKQDVDAFAEGAQQYDDITMLALFYAGRETVRGGDDA